MKKVLETHRLYQIVPAFGWLLLFALLTAAGGCQQAKDSSKARALSPGTQSESITETSQETAPPPPTGLSADDLRSLLDEQRARTEETNREIAATHDPAAVRQILLRRKGEILKAQKTIRLSDQMTPAQKDSLLQPLEQESIRISTQLMNTPR